MPFCLPIMIPDYYRFSNVSLAGDLVLVIESSTHITPNLLDTVRFQQAELDFALPNDLRLLCTCPSDLGIDPSVALRVILLTDENISN